MKPALLDILACPRCVESLDLRTDAGDGIEVHEGTLRCPMCGRNYPITGGIPRFVENGSYAASFGRQWQWFPRVQLDSQSGSTESARTLEATTGWTEADYRGRLVLDAGVGAGRFAEVVANKGGEVVGVDLSRAVDAAYENIGRRPNVHLVQADIMAMPFREGTFDLAYSVGVLHHTPDPERAFARVAAVVRKGGALAVYVYARYGPSHRFSDAIRRLTTRLPLPVLRAVSALAVPAYYLYRVPVVRGPLGMVCPISQHPDWRWRWLDTFDWYSPKYQWKLLYPEVFRWFQSNSFQNIELFDEPIRMRGSKAE
jgi:SAM-dependent methyltransferase